MLLAKTSACTLLPDTKHIVGSDVYLVARLVATVIINIICNLFSPEFCVFRVPSRGGFILMFF